MDIEEIIVNWLFFIGLFFIAFTPFSIYFSILGLLFWANAQLVIYLLDEAYKLELANAYVNHYK